jgi:hypothetical protein
MKDVKKILSFVHASEISLFMFFNYHYKACRSLNVKREHLSFQESSGHSHFGTPYLYYLYLEVLCSQIECCWMLDALYLVVIYSGVNSIYKKYM